MNNNSLLKAFSNIVVYVLMKHKCKSWFCNECKKSKALALREVLKTKIHLFRVPKLLTFTVDPSRFDSGQSAYRFVRDGFFIPRMMRFLNIRNWFCVLEFQQNGFPHWHLLVDLSGQSSAWVRKSGGVLDVQNAPCEGHFEVRNFLNLARIHRLWRKWGIGEQIDLQTKKVRVSAIHAINYIIKYLLKNPDYGYPEWVLQAHNIRLVSASRSLGALINSSLVPDDPDPDDDDDDDDEENEDLFIDDMEEKPVISTVQRVAMCGLQTKALAIENGQITGGVTFDLPYQTVCKVFSKHFKDFAFRLKSGVTCNLKSCGLELLEVIGDFSRNEQVSGLIFEKYKKACALLGSPVMELAF